jgi:ATP/ADP translocase
MPNSSDLKKLFAIFIAGFFTLSGYNAIRSVSVPIFTHYFSSDRLPEATAVMGIALFLIVWLHGQSLNKMGPKKTLFIGHIATILVFIFCHILLTQKSALAAYTLFVAKDIYIVLIIEQLWSYFNSSFTLAQAKKYAGPMAGFISIGPIFSGHLVSWCSPLLPSPEWLISITALLLIPSLISMECAYFYFPLKEKDLSEKNFTYQSFEWGNFKKFPTLKLIALLVFLGQVIAASTNFAFNAAVAKNIPGTLEQTIYYGTYYSHINLVAGLLQFILTPFLIHRFSTSTLLLLLAIFNIASNAYACWNNSLTNLMWAALCFKSLDYSLFRCVKELSYIPLSYSARYHSKQFIDVFLYRLSSSGASTLFGVGKTFFQMTDITYSAVALATSCLWGVVSAQKKSSIYKK